MPPERAHASGAFFMEPVVQLALSQKGRLHHVTNPPIFPPAFFLSPIAFYINFEKQSTFNTKKTTL